MMMMLLMLLYAMDECLLFFFCWISFNGFCFSYSRPSITFMPATSLPISVWVKKKVVQYMLTIQVN